MSNLVSTEWLAANLGKPDLLVFDTTKYLPNEPYDGMQQYLAAHIPGARFFDIDDVADRENPLPHMIPTPARFERLMAALGVSNNHRIVFYDQKGLQSSARGWWLMRLFGHEKASVLDGGLPKWIREGRDLEEGHLPKPRETAFVADFRADRVKGIGDIKAIIQQNTALILDARARGRFDGSAPEPRPGLPSGHMPGAENLPFTELFNPDGTMKEPTVLRARFARARVMPGKPVVTTCGTGVTACILTRALVQAGFSEAAVYDGSWTEWASRPETPKVAG